MAFFGEEFLFSADAVGWLLLGVALLLIVLFVGDPYTPETFFGFVDFPVHDYLKPLAYVGLGFIAVNYVLPLIATMGVPGIALFVGLIAFSAQSALNVTLEEGVIAGLVSVLLASPIFGF